MSGRSAPAALPPFDVNVISRPQAGASFFASASISTSVVQAVAKASNVNGLIIRAIRFVSGGATGALFRGTAAPSAWNDTSKVMVAAASVPITLFPDLEVPAGEGLWFIASASVGYCQVEYDLL